MKNTSLTQKHIELGAKMVEYAGFQMPVQYEGVQKEHFAVREAIGVFDVSHMGEFLVSGENALSLIQKITTNDAAKIKVGQAQYSCMPNEKAGIVDDLIIYRIKEDTYLLVVNAANIEKDWNWIEKNNTEKAELRNLSDEYSLLAIQGPKAVEAMQTLTSVNLSEIKYYHFEVGDFAGIENVIISATGYTGSGGFEIYCKNQEAETIWDKVFEAGKDFGITPAGLASRDTLRLEKGYCLYGNDINDETTPLEAGLGWITKLDTEFVARDILLQQKSAGVSKKLVGFKIVGKGIPRKGYTVLDENSEEIGEVTSGTQSPMLKEGIGLGYVKTPFSKVGSKIFIQIRKKSVEAEVVKLPFV